MTTPSSALPIYADYAATTPCDPRVLAHMMTVMQEHWGNPSSTHYLHGRRAQRQLELARAQVAALFKAREDEIAFTSGATEACNWALKAVASSRPDQQILALASEHPAITACLEVIAQAGIPVQSLPILPCGRYDRAALKAALAQPTSLVAAMLVNHQTGVMQDLAAMSELAHAQGALVLSDLTQAIPRLGPCAVADLGIDLAVCSGHKLYGPPGCGALYRRRGLHLQPLIHGGGQESGMRSGTENMPAIAGFGLAAELHLSESHQRLTVLQKRSVLLEGTLQQQLPAAVIYGQAAQRAPGITMCGLVGEKSGWLQRIHQVALSPGSSCASRQAKPSSVLIAMGVSESDAANALRVSLSHLTTEDEVQGIIHAIRQAHAITY
ncbi:MAG: cysteine desulfurase [Planctomycetota bacterium]|nr:MAG: cysteine desulfurase [Planctomycetota bacterium]